MDMNFEEESAVFNEEPVYVRLSKSLHDYIITPAINVLQNYGWYILLGIVAFAYIYEKYLKSVLMELRSTQNEAEYAAKYHKNPDLLLSRMEAQEKRVKQLQEQYRKAAEEHQKKMEEKERKKLEAMRESFESDARGGGHTLGGSDSSNKPLKTDYNPLMGHGRSSNYRPPRRSACSRGGCG